MLHILNGDALVKKFQQSHIKGDHIVWRECLFEGPVFARKNDDDFLKMRAKYICNMYGQDEAKYLNDNNEFFNKLKDFGSYDEVVLWFEHDLFCQINLMYILKVLADYNCHIKISLVLPHNYEPDAGYKGFGGSTAKELQELYSSRTYLSWNDLICAKELWYAYASPQPIRFQNMINKMDQNIPFFKRAFFAHLERFPSVDNGLNRIEQVILKAVQEGADNTNEILDEVWTQANIYGLGDLQILNYIERLKSDKLLSLGEKIEITKLGGEVLCNLKSYIKIMNMDIWIGGVHLNQNNEIWLWDKDNNTLVPMIHIVEVKSLSQIKKVEKMANKIWNEHYVPIIGKDQVEYMLSKFQNAEAIKCQINEGYRYFMTIYAGNYAGYFAILSDQAENSMFLSKLYVDKEFRGCGIAKKAITFIEGICKNEGLTRIWLTVNKNNTNSIASYHKLGFINVGSTVQDIRNGFIMDDYRMEKKLERILL